MKTFFWVFAMVTTRSQMFHRIGVLKNFANFKGKQLCWSLFLIKLQAFVTEHLRWLLLKLGSPCCNILLKYFICCKAELFSILRDFFTYFGILNFRLLESKIVNTQIQSSNSVQQKIVLEKLSKIDRKTLLLETCFNKSLQY